jgi:7,8-dihydropterin-6-yl-methyl-4-(beta-D-ribofuranosyl)aminobenzene 5'-phosphate synthase
MPLRSEPLDELQIVVLVDNETDTLSSVDPGVPQAPELAALLRRLPPSRQYEGHGCFTVFDRLCVAAHGFSALLTGRAGERRRSVLFDAGPYGHVWLANAERLGIDLALIDTIFLSHWHWDHSGALPAVVAAVSDARLAAGLPLPVVDVHPDRPDQRGIQTPAGVLVMLPEEPTLDALRAAGAALDAHDEPHLLADGLFFASGAIARRTSYEIGLAGHHTFRGAAGWPDPLIMDERFVAAHVAGRGVTVMSACSHAGIVNVCLAARDTYPDEQVDLVVGGFHLAGAAMEQRIEATVQDLAGLVEAHVLAPGHCTGWRAKAALAARFAPGRHAPSFVGSRYTRVAPPSSDARA